LENKIKKKRINIEWWWEGHIKCTMWEGSKNIVAAREKRREEVVLIPVFVQLYLTFVFPS